MSNQYAGLRRAMAKEKGAVPRCAERLLAMRKSLASLRKRRSDASLLLTTWNITEKVWFRRIAGEIVLPDGQLVVSQKKVKPPKYQQTGRRSSRR